MKCEKPNLHRNNPKKTYKALSQPTIFTIKPFLKKLNKTSTYRVSNLKQRFQKKWNGTHVASAHMLKKGLFHQKWVQMRTKLFTGKRLVTGCNTLATDNDDKHILQNRNKNQQEVSPDESSKQT